MVPPEALLDGLRDYGLWIVGIASIVEGPIVTVLSSALAREGLFPLALLAPILVAGDLLGDLLHFALGRYGVRRIPPRWRRALGLGAGRVQALARHFDSKGGRTLVLGKLTHSAGAAVLVAAGMARMPLVPFIGWNLLATLPKTARLIALGWYMGGAWRQIDQWLGRGALVALAMILVLIVIWYYRRRQCKSG
jgi:membrane protein DedA with SNARE-associated domain